MWISGPTKGLENIFLLLQSTSNPDKRVYEGNISCENDFDIPSLQPVKMLRLWLMFATWMRVAKMQKESGIQIENEKIEKMDYLENSKVESKLAGTLQHLLKFS